MTHLVEALWSWDTPTGYAAFKELLNLSQDSDVVYLYIDQFIERINSDNSYFRTRALALIVVNAKWDVSCQLDAHLDSILSHIVDNKPITARQFIKNLPVLAQNKPEWQQDILSALNHADISCYPLTMRALVARDIQNALSEINHSKGLFGK